jgi:hypothetical protein
MGFNFSKIGYESVSEMFENFSTDIRYHILGFFDFVKGTGESSPMIIALQRKRFEDFATYYNGSGLAAEYGGLIEEAYDDFSEISA